jgi:hypothetical protein
MYYWSPACLILIYKFLHLIKKKKELSVICDVLLFACFRLFYWVGFLVGCSCLWPLCLGSSLASSSLVEVDCLLPLVVLDAGSAYS